MTLPGYLPPIAIGDVVRSGGVGEVVASRSDRYQPGQLVFGMLGWQEYALADEAESALTVLPPGLDPTVAIGVLGVTGMTAYFGLFDIGQPRPGDTVVVSGAAGATGSVVGQLARIEGAGTVVGIAGSDEKCAWLTDELGFDHAINYRDEDVGARLRATCPDGIDVYFDNVGGEILDDVPGPTVHEGAGGAVRCHLPVQRGPPPGPSQLPQPHREAGSHGGILDPGLPGPVPRGPVAHGRLGHGGPDSPP